MFVEVRWIWCERVASEVKKKAARVKGGETKVQKSDIGRLSERGSGCTGSHDSISRLVDFLFKRSASHFYFFFARHLSPISFPTSDIIFHSTSSTHIHATVCAFYSYDLNGWEYFPIFFFYYNIIKQNTFEWCLISVLLFPFFGAIRFGTSRSLFDSHRAEIWPRPEVE